MANPAKSPSQSTPSDTDASSSPAIPTGSPEKPEPPSSSGALNTTKPSIDEELTKVAIRVVQASEREKARRPPSYTVIIKARGTTDIIQAPVWLSTREEARAFGELSVRVLGYYCFLEKWKIEETDRTPNYLFEDGQLLPINRC
jgi:hypothetical protein